MKNPLAGKKGLRFLAGALILAITPGLALLFSPRAAAAFFDRRDEIIVIDAGHGGVDGGTNRDGLLEKEINLDIARKLADILADKGYRIVMTRDTDTALDHLDDSSKSRHKRDLNARVKIINSSDAAFFISVHVNSTQSNAAISGSIVFYDGRYSQNESLARCIQDSLNGITVNGEPRKAHAPQPGNYFILKHTDIPGVIVETAFITNKDERALLSDNAFRTRLASAIADGAVTWLASEDATDN